MFGAQWRKTVLSCLLLIPAGIAGAGVQSWSGNLENSLRVWGTPRTRGLYNDFTEYIQRYETGIRGNLGGERFFTWHWKSRLEDNRRWLPGTHWRSRHITWYDFTGRLLPRAALGADIFLLRDRTRIFLPGEIQWRRDDMAGMEVHLMHPRWPRARVGYRMVRNEVENRGFQVTQSTNLSLEKSSSQASFSCNWHHDLRRSSRAAGVHRTQELALRGWTDFGRNDLQTVSEVNYNSLDRFRSLRIKWRLTGSFRRRDHLQTILSLNNYRFRGQETLINGAGIYYRRALSKPLSLVQRLNLTRRLARSPASTSENESFLSQSGMEYLRSSSDSTGDGRLGGNAGLYWRNDETVQRWGFSAGVFQERRRNISATLMITGGYRSSGDLYRDSGTRGAALTNRAFLEGDYRPSSGLGLRQRLTGIHHLGGNRGASLELRTDAWRRKGAASVSSGFIWDFSLLPEKGSLLRWVNTLRYDLTRRLRCRGQSSWTWNITQHLESAWVEAGITWNIRRMSWQLAWRDEIHNGHHHHSARILATRSLGDRQ